MSDEGQSNRPPKPLWAGHVLDGLLQKSRLMGAKSAPLTAGSRTVVNLDYPVRPEIRFGWHKPAHPQIRRRLSIGDFDYVEFWRELQGFTSDFASIAVSAADPKEPSWKNDWIPSLDAMSLYGFVAQKNPRIYIEVGSGNSTKFVARAIRDHGLRTQIISIDPQPRAEIDAICNEVIRQPLETIDLSIFSILTEDDVLFCDDSHRSFQNSDVTIFFVEILPSIKSGVLIGVHDIFLPHDYPSLWLERYYNEQYLLACWLLGGDTLRVKLPVYYCATEERFANTISPIFAAEPLNQLKRTGGCFWFTRQ